MVSFDFIYGQDHRIAKWVANQLPFVGSQGFGPSRAIGVMKNEELVAGVIYHRYIEHDIEMSIYATSPKWCTKGVLRHLFTYPFVQLGVKRITATIPADNKRAQDFVERLGFLKEGCLRKGFDKCDAYLYGYLKEECQFLKERENG